MSTQLPSLKVFYSYAQSDSIFQHELEKHLTALKREQVITQWHNRDIQAGQEWKHEINTHLNTADIILLLVSSDFLASDYCYSIEMRQALERHQHKEARIIPILLRPVDYEGTPIENLLILPSGKKPITQWGNRDAAFFEIAKSIREVIREIQVERSASFSDKDRQITPANSQNQFFLNEKTEQTKHYARLVSLPHETINTHTAFALFQQLMQPRSALRVLRIIGDGKMGKSHLLTKVFPALSQKHFQARYVTLDLRNQLYSVPENLKIACDFIGIQHCTSYNSAYQVWLSRTRQTHMKAQGIQRIYAFFQALKKEPLSDPYFRDLDLTHCFVRDISALNDKPLLLLIDSVSSASESMQQWLMDVLLVQIVCLSHVRIVVAGRSLPNPHGSYASFCTTHQLKAVTDVEEYITYCQKTNLSLGKQAIQAIAYGCDYIPGAFIDFVNPKFAKQRTAYG